MPADNRAEEIKLLAREHAELAIGTLAEVASDPEARDSARVKAADVLLQRGFGAPERKVEQTIDVNVYDQRQAHLTALQKLADKRRQITDQRRRDDIEDADWEEIEEKEEKENDDG